MDLEASAEHSSKVFICSRGASSRSEGACGSTSEVERRSTIRRSPNIVFSSQIDSVQVYFRNSGATQCSA